MDTEQVYSQLRQKMVEEQLASRGIRDERVLTAMGRVPRHRFISAQQMRAYEDAPLPIGHNQTISQPYIVAYMLEALHLWGSEKVLEIGTGSGYEAALLGELAAEVHTVERFAGLADEAERVLADLGCKNVHVHQGDGSGGLLEHAPYDAIVVSAGAPLVPRPLLYQLAPGGRLLLPVGKIGQQTLQLWTQAGERFEYEELVTVAFVPLVGDHGWNQ